MPDEKTRTVRERHLESRETLLAQAGLYLDPATGAVVPPLHTSTTFARDRHYQPLGDHLYGREGSPTYEPVERLLAALEGGAEALLFASGLAAATAVLAGIETGGHVVAPRIMYHGLQTWLRRLAARGAIVLDLVDASDPDAIAAALRPGATRLVWLETLLNPSWDVVDIERAAAAAHAAGAILAVDATVTPPVTLRALDLGADLVFHSATKYLNGHSDVIAGALITRQVDDRWRELGTVRTLTGGVLGPFEAWLLLRGMRTLALRYQRASASALAIASHLAGHDRVHAVLYPGLPDHPGHAVARRQMSGGYGGMLSIRVRGGAAAAKAVATATRLFVPATSLGGVESLIEHRATIEGPESTVPADLLRLSVGIEDEAELIADLDGALACAGGAGR